MDDRVVHRLALIFMAAAAALTSSLWAHDHTPAPQRTADTTQADKDVRVSEPVSRSIMSSGGKAQRNVDLSAAGISVP